jgi:molybdopterin synthase catalytic subunit
MMLVRVLTFGVLKDWLDSADVLVELPVGSSVADLLERLNAARPTPMLRGIAVSVNAEFAGGAQQLKDGDEVGLLPPVSGGSSRFGKDSNEDAASLVPEQAKREIALTRDPIDKAGIVAAARRDEDGALVIFDGVVRNHSRGRQTLYLEYEAYEEMALRQMEALAEQARSQISVRHVSLVHRLGRVEIGESSVLIVVASAHRGPAFEACRWVIDSLKKTVPIWKREVFVDGAVWAQGEPFPDAVAVVPEAGHGG